MGFLTPLLAAFIHVASELTFILNSTRLLPVGGANVSPHTQASQDGRQLAECGEK
jgi:hypothetical protein